MEWWVRKVNRKADEAGFLAWATREVGVSYWSWEVLSIRIFTGNRWYIQTGQPSLMKGLLMKMWQSYARPTRNGGGPQDQQCKGPLPFQGLKWKGGTGFLELRKSIVIATATEGCDLLIPKCSLCQPCQGRQEWSQGTQSPNFPLLSPSNLPLVPPI